MVSAWRTRTHEWKFSLLLLALLVAVLVPALRGDPRRTSSSLLWGIVLLAAVNTVSGKPRRTLIFTGVAVVVLGGRLATVIGSTSIYQGSIDAGGYTVTAIFFAMTLYTVFVAVLGAERIRGDTVMGAVCVYLLIGFMWTNFYALVELAEPGSFNMPAYAPLGDGSLIPELTFGYYSFVTLTTLGYGDVTPISYTARTLSWLEAVVGVSYMATVIAFLISQVVVDRQQGRRV